MVRNTALNLCEYRQKGSPFIPKPLTPIESAEWANTLASRFNVTVMPGELSKDFLMKAINQGSTEERQAVLDYLRVIPVPDSKVITAISTIVEKEMRPLQDAGAYAMWFLSMAGTLSI
jgi:hypothetical protein